MPIYEVEAPDGRILEIEGNQPPSEKELDDIFASIGSDKQPQQPEYKQMSLKEVFNATPDELNENMKALGRQRLQQRADWEQAHPFISEIQKSFQPNYRADVIDMQNQAQYGLQVPFGQQLKGEVQKAGQNLVPSINLATAVATSGLGSAKGLIPSIGRGMLQGGIQGGIEGLTSGIADEGLSVEALKRGLGETGAGATVGGLIETIPFVGKPLAKPILRAIESPQAQKALTKGIEVLTSVPQKFSDLALQAELAGKSILGGKFNPETAYQGVERKLRTAKGMLPTDKQYKEQYKKIGNQVREKLKQLNLPETYFDNKYSEIGKNAYENLQNLKRTRGQAVGEAVENLDPNINFNVDELQKVLDDVYNNFSVSGVQGLNVARNTVKDVYDNVQNLINLKDTITPKELKDILNNISDYPINWNDSTAKARQNILKQLYGGYSNLLKQKSPELAKANQSFAEISSALNNIGNPERARLAEQIRNYASNAGKQIRSGENVALEEINNILPKEQQFLQNAINLQANKNAQDLLNKNISEGILNDISKYQNAPYATQEALERIAPEQVQQFADLYNQQATQKDILNRISSKSFEKNPRLLANRNDVGTEEALAYLQENTGINFMDELENVRAREALEKLLPGQGGGSGSEQGFGNLLRTSMLGGIPTLSAITHNPLLLGSFGLISPKITGKGLIQNVGRLYRGLKNPNINTDILRNTAIPLSVPLLQGGVVYNEDRY